MAVAAVLGVGIAGSNRAETGHVATEAASVPKPATKVLSTTQTETDPGRPWMRRFEPGERPPQFVVFSFDGGGYADRWQLFLDAAKAAQATFTVFMTGTYFLPEVSRADYTPPGNRPGRSDVASSKNDQQLAMLLSNLNRAVSDGHELGSHAVGHLCAGGQATEVGATWTAAQWGTELDQFTVFFQRAKDRAPELIGKPLLANPDTVEGFRAPCLEYTEEALMPALVDRGYRYDSSAIATGVEWPTKTGGLWEFPISTVYVVRQLKGTGAAPAAWDHLGGVVEVGGVMMVGASQKTPAPMSVFNDRECQISVIAHSAAADALAVIEVREVVPHRDTAPGRMTGGGAGHKWVTNSGAFCGRKWHLIFRASQTKLGTRPDHPLLPETP